jgi:hypothetical protein
MDRFGQLTLALASSLALVACPGTRKDPPPPEETTAIASAAPRALGALAGGTDAAPPVVFAPRQPTGEDEAVPLPELDPDAGAEPPDAAAPGDDLPL